MNAPTSPEGSTLGIDHPKALNRLFFLISFVAYSYFFHFGEWNSNSRFDLTFAIVEHGQCGYRQRTAPRRNGTQWTLPPTGGTSTQANRPGHPSWVPSSIGRYITLQIG